MRPRLHNVLPFGACVHTMNVLRPIWLSSYALISKLLNWYFTKWIYKNIKRNSNYMSKTTYLLLMASQTNWTFLCVRVCVCVFLCNGVSEDLNPKGMLLMHCYGKPRHKSRDLCHGYLWSTFDTPYNCQKVTWLMFGHLLNEIPATSNTCRPGSRSVGLGFLQNLMWNTTEASYTEFSSVSHTQFGIVSLLLGWCMRKSTALNCGEPQRMTCGAAFSLSHNWRPAWFQSGSTDSSDHKVYVWYSGPLDFHLEGENIITAPGLLANAFFQCMLLSVAQLKESKLNYFTWQMLPAKFIMTTV